MYRHLALLAAVFLTLLLLGESVVRQYEDSLLEAVDSDTQAELASASMTLQAVADRNFDLMASLDAYVRSFDDTYPKVAIESLTPTFLRTLYDSSGSTAFNFIIAPDGIASYVYPRQGNEAIVGWNFLHDPRPEIKRQIRHDLSDKKMHIYGPIELLQGNTALIARKAVYRGSQFWGFISVSQDLERLLAQSQIGEGEATVAIRQTGEPAFYGDDALFAGKHFARDVIFMDSRWEMGAVPAETSLREARRHADIVRGMGLFALILIMLLYVGIWRQRDTLRKMVERRTRELRESNDELAAINENLAHGERELREQYVLLDQYADALRESERKLSHMAYHDMLTDVSNRAAFLEELGRTLADGDDDAAAVLFFDLDRFKSINDNYGHQKGDDMLIEVVRRIRAKGLNARMLARFGGDEFAVLLAGLAEEISKDAIKAAAEAVLSAFEEPFFILGQSIYMSPSIGIARYPEDGDDQGTLLMKADIAMYQVKREGGGHYRFFEPFMETESLLKLEMGNHLREAMQRGELEVHYQPQVDCAEGRVFGIEALLRWNHTSRGYISPSQFIPLAEELNLISAIGEWVLRQACEYANRLQRTYGIPLQVSVNLSVKQLREKDIVAKVREALAATGLLPADLELEITENMAMKDEQLETLGELRRLGVAISIDDFGTHYSSLSYLKRFPVTKIKLDQFFVRGIGTDERDRAMIQAVILMAKSFRLEVLAEGVETLEQARFLRASGCELIQGYYFYRPMDPSAVERILLEPIDDKIPPLADG
ncbi:putative bifunctional diguanylate cyclase/phosphodiesterase [Paenibacillus methanolicus]|uniref:Diguanylate cyclase (GGDEF)-like protein n=1 Tax=Paenibacillus methanolicus TaxID=582686 RepID=A0A5S5BXE7_9BACL|nr:EAL domain-containing protein [Paenibacillus methanolicus]TYP70810.1 diguanylate cyclase (GGDEF)-like protein [Paenibacillus methanolicus]